MQPRKTRPCLIKKLLMGRKDDQFKQTNKQSRPLAGYGLPPPPPRPRGNFVDHNFLKAQCLARILQHVSPLTMAALS